MKISISPNDQRINIKGDMQPVSLQRDPLVDQIIYDTATLEGRVAKKTGDETFADPRNVEQHFDLWAAAKRAGVQAYSNLVESQITAARADFDDAIARHDGVVVEPVEELA